MLLCYVDESFKKNFFGFAAVIAEPQVVKDLAASLDQIVQQASASYGIPWNSEIHGYPMFHGKDDWRAVGVRARVGIFKAVINEIVTSDVTILMRSIDGDRLAHRQSRENYPVNFPPDQVCFQHIMQRLNALAAKRKDLALIIADEMSNSDRHRERFATYQTRGTPGAYMRTELRQLIDTIHFAPSHRSRLLQAADILSFTFHRHTTVVESDKRSQAAMDEIWSAIEGSGKLHDVGSWP